MDPESIVASVLSALLSEDLVRMVFRRIFPVGAPIDIPINRLEVSQDIFSATMCPSGCGVRVVIRDLNVTIPRTGSFPLAANISIDLGVASIVNGVRAPWRIETTAGDLDLDLDTSRGATNLKFKFVVLFNSRTTPQGYFRVNNSLIPEGMRFEGLTMDVSEIVPIPGFELERADLSFEGASILGAATVRIINAYIEQLVPYMRALIRYVLNTELCRALGTTCPRRPIPDAPTLRLGISPIMIAAGLTTVALFGAILWRASKQTQKLPANTQE